MRFEHRRSRQRGVEIVESVLLLPFVLLLFFGIVELSVGFFDQAILTNASRAAARELIRAAPLDGNWAGWDQGEAAAEDAADQAAQRMITWGGAEELAFDWVQGPLCVERDGYDDRPSITVTLTYPYRFFVLPAFLAGLSDLTLTAQTDMCVLPRRAPAS